MEYQIKAVVGYEGLYEVDNQGNVWSLNYNQTGERRKISRWDNNKGYLCVSLYKNRKQKNYLIHRLVAEAFIENPNNLPEINHIDEDKHNNNVDNLEFCDRRYNLLYSNIFEKSAKARSRAVLQFTKDGQFVAEYPSTHEAERQTGIWQANINSCCLGKYGHKSAGGYKWSYKNN